MKPDRPLPFGLVYVRDVYGDSYLVCRADLDGPRVQLPLYRATGMRVSEHRAHMGWPLGPTTLHRGNIREVTE